MPQPPFFDCDCPTCFPDTVSQPPNKMELPYEWTSGVAADWTAPQPLSSGRSWCSEQQILEVLSSLSYRAGELESYLSQIACGVSRLLGADWAVLTLHSNGEEQVMASSHTSQTSSQLYSLAGSLTRIVMETGQFSVGETAPTLALETAIETTLAHPDYEIAALGCISYLGVPLRTAHLEVIGAICCFCKYPHPFGQEEIRTAELFAERAATVIDNYLLYQQQRRFNELLEAEVAKRSEELQLVTRRLIERERLAAIGEFAAMIVHEIRNPVTTIRLGLNHFHRSSGPRDRERAELALEEAERLERMLEEVLLYAKPQILQATALEVNELIQDLLPSLRQMPEAADRRLQYQPLAAGVHVMGDRDKLKQVLINLIRNACEAIAPQETVTLRIGSATRPAHVQIQVHNGGDPIPAAVLARLGEPFYSTKPSGTGLGLAIVRRIVEAHGGMFSIQSSAEAGTMASVELPFARVE